MLYLSFSPLRSVWLHAQALKKQPPKLRTQLLKLQTLLLMPLLKALTLQPTLLQLQPTLLQLQPTLLQLQLMRLPHLLPTQKPVKWLLKRKKLRSNLLSFA